MSFSGELGSLLGDCKMVAFIEDKAAAAVGVLTLLVVAGFDAKTPLEPPVAEDEAEAEEGLRLADEKDSLRMLLHQPL